MRKTPLVRTAPAVACSLLIWASAAAIAVEPAAVEKPGPEISVALRGAEDETIEQGEPFRVLVRLVASDELKGSLQIAPANATWAEAISVEITPAAGGNAVVRADAVGKPDSSTATLDADHVAGGLWRFSAESAQRLAPGDYVVRARLAIDQGAGWTGEVVSEEMPLRVIASSTDASRVVRRTLNEVQDALLIDHFEEAAKRLDAVLKQSPNEPRLLRLRAEVALRGGNPTAAMICVNRAKGDPTLQDDTAIADEQELKSRIMAAMLAERTEGETSPAWTWPPVEVMARSPEETQAAMKTDSIGVDSHKAEPAAATTRPVQPSTATAGVLVPAADDDDEKFRADASAQWASTARAGSEYGDSKYSASQATGVSNIRLGMAGNNPDAWCPANQNEGTDWLETTFAKPVHATEVRVLQNNEPGAIVKIEAIEPDGTTHVWWEGTDPYVAQRVREIAWFVVRIPKTEYLVAKIKVTLNLAAVPGWKEIDAVQLVGTSP